MDIEERLAAGFLACGCILWGAVAIIYTAVIVGAIIVAWPHVDLPLWFKIPLAVLSYIFLGSLLGNITAKVRVD